MEFAENCILYFLGIDDLSIYTKSNPPNILNWFT